MPGKFISSAKSMRNLSFGRQVTINMFVNQRMYKNYVLNQVFVIFSLFKTLSVSDGHSYGFSTIGILFTMLKL